MILIKNREMLFSNREQYLGSTADGNSEIRIFKIDRVMTVDIAHLTFKIDLKYSNGGKDTCSLEKEVSEDNIILQWLIPPEVLQVPGPIFANLRATDEIGAVKWSSFVGVFYSEEAINTPGSWEGNLTELEKVESRLIGYKNSAESAASEAGNSKEEAVSAKEIAVSAANTAVKAKNEAENSKNEAGKSKEDAEAARDAAQLAKEQAEQISGAGIATKQKAGIVQPDGETIEVDELGKISVPKATVERAGLVKPDGTTLGFEGELLKSLVKASGLKTTDTNGILGEENAEVMLQALLDEITNRVVNQILTKSMLINNGLTTESGKYPLDAAYGKTLADLISGNTSAITQLNSDLRIRIITQKFTSQSNERTDLFVSYYSATFSFDSASEGSAVVPIYGTSEMVGSFCIILPYNANCILPKKSTSFKAYCNKGNTEYTAVALEFSI